MRGSGKDCKNCSQEGYLSVKKGIDLNDLPERYRKQALAKIKAQSAPADNQQNTGNALQGEEEAPRFNGWFNSPVRIVYTTTRKKLADADGNFTKYFTDALVDAGILADDSPKYVKEISHRQEKGSEEGTVIEIWPALI